MEHCPDCGVALPAVMTGGHAYLGASPSCWAAYGELLAREYQDPAYFAAHRLTVDAYCAQHPGRPERRAIQSINVHLAGLCVTIEHGARTDDARQVIARLVAQQAARFVWLDPPPDLGEVRVTDVLRAEDASAHHRATRRWAEAVWQAWAPHHRHVRALSAAARR